MKRIVISAATVIAIVAMSACAMEGDDPTSSTAKGLHATYTLELVHGTFEQDGQTVHFRAELVGEMEVFVEFELNGMTLTAKFLRDGEQASAEMDGYATENGEETQLQEDDRELLKSLAIALSQDKLEREPYPAKMLRNSAVIWAKTPLNMILTRTVQEDLTRSVSYICTKVNGNQTWTGNHDCHQGCPWYNPFCSKTHYNTVDLGPGGYYSNIGECTFPGMDNNSYTQDCLNHDLCVAGPHNHWDVSGYCMNEAASASDDQAWNYSCGSCSTFGCGGGVSNSTGTCWCDSLCHSYGDCCYDKNAVCGAG